MRQLAILALLAATAFFAGAVRGQGLELKVGAGYGGGVMATYDHSDQNVYWFGFYDGLAISDNESRLGTGAQFQVGAHYYFNEHFGLGLEGGYLLSTNPMETSRYTIMGIYYDDWGDDYVMDGTERVEQRGSAFFFAPMVYAAATPADNLRFYAGAGPLFGLASINVEREGATNDFDGYAPFSVQTSSEARLSGGMAIGTRLTLGGDYFVSSKVGLFGELTFNALNYAPTQGEYDSFTVNGEDALGGFSNKSWEIVQNPSEVEQIQFADEPGEAEEQIRRIHDTDKRLLNQKYSFSSVSFNLGVKFRF